jgi:hypothetical protein
MSNTNTFVAVVEFIKEQGYNQHKHYDFLCNLPVKSGNIVVVDTVNGLQLAEVVGIKNSSGRAAKWVVDKVNVEAHQQRIAAEQARAKLLTQMRAQAKKASELEQFERIAQTDPTMAQMLVLFKQADEQSASVVNNWIPNTINLMEVEEIK